MRKVVLIGTSHKFQISSSQPCSAEAEQFRQVLRVLCREHTANALAEELHPEELECRKVTKSICREVAHELGLAHQYSDMSDSERKSRDYRHQHEIWVEANNSPSTLRGTSQCEIYKLIEPEVRRNHLIKEQYWLCRLQELDTWPVVFVCGADHYEHFALLLGGLSFDVFAAFPDWRPSRT